MMNKNFIIGFTVGVWDIFHDGHLNFLQEARNNCHYLHVGIMTDYWVAVQKGHERPYQSLQLRLVGLRSCKYVNNVVILDTLDMSPYLQMCDVWIKGEDQKNMKPFEFKNSIYIKRTPEISSTELINEKNKFLG